MSAITWLGELDLFGLLVATSGGFSLSRDLRVKCKVNSAKKIATNFTQDSQQSKPLRIGCTAVSFSTTMGRLSTKQVPVISLPAAFEQLINGYQSLHVWTGMIHRDISINRLIVNEDAENFSWSGYLIDLDLKIKKQRVKSPGTCGHNGTQASMATEVLMGGKAPSFMHNLESFFGYFSGYVFTTMGRMKEELSRDSNNGTISIPKIQLVWKRRSTRQKGVPQGRRGELYTIIQPLVLMSANYGERYSLTAEGGELQDQTCTLIWKR